jgi:hypothetical protein
MWHLLTIKKLMYGASTTFRFIDAELIGLIGIARGKIDSQWILTKKIRK